MVVLVAALAASAGAHPNGQWLYPVLVQHQLTQRYPGIGCVGVGVHRFTISSVPANSATWQFKHFVCEFPEQHSAKDGFLCVHSRPSGTLLISRVMHNGAYTPCRF